MLPQMCFVHLLVLEDHTAMLTNQRAFTVANHVLLTMTVRGEHHWTKRALQRSLSMHVLNVATQSTCGDQFAAFRTRTLRRFAFVDLFNMGRQGTLFSIRLVTNFTGMHQDFVSDFDDAFFGQMRALVTIQYDLHVRFKGAIRIIANVRLQALMLVLVVSQKLGRSEIAFSALVANVSGALLVQFLLSLYLHFGFETRLVMLAGIFKIVARFLLTTRTLEVVDRVLVGVVIEERLQSHHHIRAHSTMKLPELMLGAFVFSRRARRKKQLLTTIDAANVALFPIDDFERVALVVHVIDGLDGALSLLTLPLLRRRLELIRFDLHRFGLSDLMEKVVIKIAAFLETNVQVVFFFDVVASSIGDAGAIFANAKFVYGRRTFEEAEAIFGNESRQRKRLKLETTIDVVGEITA